ncbi:hypothetical protein As57867_004177, partial [Aphanomyces stellatus]
WYASAALFVMAAINIYSTVCISKVMLEAPKHVRTFGDLGEFVLGTWGRWLVTIPHMITCILVPIAFLVLGGTLLTTLFPASFEPETWIIIMGITLLPLCLIPTLKEGAMMAAAGFLSTIIANVVALGMLVYKMHSTNVENLSVPSPNLSFKQVATVFGNLALAYGAGLTIPSLQREHSEPQRMPRVIVVSLVLITLLFFVDSVIGVSVLGCQIPGNLLYAIAGNELGTTFNRGGVVITYLSMQMHITIAFSVVLLPAFYTLERLFLGIHKPVVAIAAAAQAQDDVEAAGPIGFVSSHTPNSPTKIATDDDAHDIDSATYSQPGVFPKVAVLRIVTVACCVVVAVLWKDRLLDLLDFAGGSTYSLCCMIVPMVLSLKHFGKRLHVVERALAILACLIVAFLGAYVTYITAGPLFSPAPKAIDVTIWDSPKFSYCSDSFVNVIYTNTSYHSAWRKP